VRRSSSHRSFLAEEQKKLLASLATSDARAIARTLSEFVVPERAAGLRSVLDARLDSVTVVMDAPHDPHKGAAIIRSCDAFGVQRLGGRDDRVERAGEPEHGPADGRRPWPTLNAKAP